MHKKVTVSALCLTMLVAGCTDVGGQSSSRETKKAQEANQTSLLASSPIPTLDRSEERENLIKRATRLNQGNMVGCVSIFTPNGVLLYQGVVDGKVSSLNSYLLPGDQYMDDPYGTYDAGSLVIEGPDIDGAYGENADGVFFFNADSDAYIEAGGVTYIYTDQCLKTEQKPLLIQQVAGQ